MNFKNRMSEINMIEQIKVKQTANIIKLFELFSVICVWSEIAI